MRPSATSILGLKLLVFRGLKLQVVVIKMLNISQLATGYADGNGADAAPFSAASGGGYGEGGCECVCVCVCVCVYIHIYCNIYIYTYIYTYI
jgi:hypothetical protein